MKVRIKRVGTHDLPLPKYETEGAAGFDLRAASEGEIWLMGSRSHPQVIGCGFAFEVPEGYELQVRPRSGLTRAGVHVALGTVDSDYRGEVGVAIWVDGNQHARRIAYGDRIAQGVIAPVVRAEFDEVGELSETARGAKGFGSTGV